ncbi:hypothetical protein J6590_033097 [Homalodisca vitripennis]|nr:hypothetical protein J6590_033097 [Homalodisca vitripennis]
MSIDSRFLDRMWIFNMFRAVVAIPLPELASHIAKLIRSNHILSLIYTIVLAKDPPMIAFGPKKFVDLPAKRESEIVEQIHAILDTLAFFPVLRPYGNVDPRSFGVCLSRYTTSIIYTDRTVSITSDTLAVDVVSRPYGNVDPRSFGVCLSRYTTSIIYTDRTVSITSDTLAVDVVSRPYGNVDPRSFGVCLSRYTSSIIYTDRTVSITSDTLAVDVVSHPYGKLDP